MRHCVDFKPFDSWFLYPTEEYSKRKLDLGFCPICGAPVAQYWQIGRISGGTYQVLSGIEANRLCEKLRAQVEYKGSDVRLTRAKAKTYGWLYGVNKVSSDGQYVEQFAKDFHGASEFVKRVKTPASG